VTERFGVRQRTRRFLGDRAVTMFELLAGAAWTGLVAADAAQVEREQIWRLALSLVKRFYIKSLVET
jgi:hypothetical protein